MAKAKKGGGGKLSRSETVTVRLDPKLRFAAELAARKHRRTLSSFIEWAVEEAAQKVSIKFHDEAYEENSQPWHEYAIDAIKNVWDVDEADRFVKLALRYPDLLTHEEEVLWKLIVECGFLWKGHFKDAGVENKVEWTWKARSGGIIFDRLREHWETFQLVANGELSKSELPGWEKEKMIEPKLDPDDIPF